MPTDLLSATPAAILKHIVQLCEEHDRVKVKREEDDRGVILTIRARSVAPVSYLLKARR